MIILSQNKKIAAASLMVFMVSFTSMYFFLNSKEIDSEAGKADVLHVPVDASHHEFDGALEDESQPIFVTTSEGVLTGKNEAFCEFLRYSCARWMGKNVFDLVSSEGHSDLVAAHTKVLQNTKKIEAVGPVSIDNKLVLLTMDPILGKDKKVLYIAFYLKDLTKKIEALQ